MSLEQDWEHRDVGWSFFAGFHMGSSRPTSPLNLHFLTDLWLGIAWKPCFFFLKKLVRMFFRLPWVLFGWQLSWEFPKTMWKTSSETGHPVKMIDETLNPTHSHRLDLSIPLNSSFQSTAKRFTSNLRFFLYFPWKKNGPKIPLGLSGSAGKFSTVFLTEKKTNDRSQHDALVALLHPHTMEMDRGGDGEGRSNWDFVGVVMGFFYGINDDKWFLFHKNMVVILVIWIVRDEWLSRYSYSIHLTNGIFVWDFMICH